jgi:putative heme-binding domain-containing protein
VTKDGTVTDGFLVEQNPAAIVLRFPGSEDRRIARRDVQSADFLRRSLMPEGLLESMTSEQVSDLFAHLLSLK